MKSQSQMIKSITFKIVRQKIYQILDPGYMEHVVQSEINTYLSQIINDMLQHEQEKLLNRQPYERIEGSVYRNGTRNVNVWGFGSRMSLKKPVVRKGTIHFPLLTALKAAGKYVSSVIAGSVWLKGPSTRATAETIRNAFGIRMNPSDISVFTNTLEPIIKQLENRPVPDSLLYLFLDAFYLPVCRHKMASAAGFTEKQAMLCAIGIDAEGKSHVLGFTLGDRENTGSWGALVDDLLKRGLDRKTLRLVISDEHKAIISVVADKLGLPHQYCLFHKMRNVRLRVAAPDQKEFLKDFKLIYWAESLDQSQRAAGVLEGKWKKRYPKAVEIALNNFENFTMFFREPKTRWRNLRTSNKIERFIRELRRRLKPAGAMHTELELRKLCWTVSIAQEKRWHSRKVFKS